MCGRIFSRRAGPSGSCAEAGLWVSPPCGAASPGFGSPASAGAPPSAGAAGASAGGGSIRVPLTALKIWRGFSFVLIQSSPRRLMFNQYRSPSYSRCSTGESSSAGITKPHSTSAPFTSSSDWSHFLARYSTPTDIPGPRWLRRMCGRIASKNVGSSSSSAAVSLSQSSGSSASGSASRDVSTSLRRPSSAADLSSMKPEVRSSAAASGAGVEAARNLASNSARSFSASAFAAAAAASSSVQSRCVDRRARPVNARRLSGGVW